MPLWGAPTSSRWGHPDEMCATIELADFGDGVRVRIKPHAGYGQWARLVVDGIPQGPPVFLPESQFSQLIGLYESDESPHIVSVVPQGDWADDSIDPSYQQTSFMAGRSDRIYAQVTTSTEQFSYGDSSQLASWALTGLRRFSNCSAVRYRPQWGRLTLTLTNSAGTRTVTLKRGNTTICSGSRSGDGSITLAEANDSGVSGTVSVTYTGDVTSGGYFVARFPKQLKLHHKSSSFGGGDFPRTAEGTIYDDGTSNTFYYRSAKQGGAGTYYVVAHQVDDVGNEGTGTQSGGATVAIVLPPEPPGTPVYTSGDYSNTVISFAASATAGATYKYYDSGDGGILDLQAETGTHASGSGTLTQALGAISSGFTGIRYVVIRAVNGGVTEGNSKVLEIEYASGAVVLPRPPVPYVQGGPTTAARLLTVAYTINTMEQKGTPATIKLYVVASGSAINYASPQASASIGTAVGGIVSGTISYTVAGDGAYIYALRTQTSGGTQSDNTDTYGPVKLNTAAPSDPTTILVREGV